jgi:alkanesulfonate monooxygenase SsuD/methylene tetrahydromethanopterin reductase-like flavin-dependent oxidoreductase (luciferase family)
VEPHRGSGDEIHHREGLNPEQSLKFGYILPNYGDKTGPGDRGQNAKVAEEEGFDSVWAVDDVVMPSEMEPYCQRLEPLTTLGFVAAATEMVRLGTSRLVIPQRNPISFEGQAATLEVFCGGRVILGLRAGWAEKAFEFLNAGFADRGRVFDGSMRLMRALWREDLVSFEGRIYAVRDAVFPPEPLYGGIHLWVGGTNPQR